MELIEIDPDGQKYYFASAKELMRINGTTKSLVANHLAESISGATTIRAFEEEERFFVKNLNLIDTNASPFFHSFSANEWLIQRLEVLSAIVLSSSALCMILLPPGTFSPGEYLFELCIILRSVRKPKMKKIKIKILESNMTFICFELVCLFNYRNYCYCRICWNGNLVWSFIEHFPRVLNSKSVHSSKLYHFCRKAKSIHAYTKRSPSSD